MDGPRAWAALGEARRWVAAQEVAERIQELNAAGTVHKGRAGERQAQVFEAFCKRRKRHCVPAAWSAGPLGRRHGIQPLDLTIRRRRPTPHGCLARWLEPRRWFTDGSQAWSPGRAMFHGRLGLTGFGHKDQGPDAAVVFSRWQRPFCLAGWQPRSFVRRRSKVVQFNGLGWRLLPPAATETRSDPPPSDCGSFKNFGMLAY